MNGFILRKADGLCRWIGFSSRCFTERWMVTPQWLFIFVPQTASADGVLNFRKETDFVTT